MITPWAETKARAESRALTLDAYQQGALKTAKRWDSDKDARRYHALKIAGEAGEVADAIGKEMTGKILDRRHVLEELGDVLWHAAVLADELGSSLSWVAQANLIKLAKRHGDSYNAGFYEQQDTGAHEAEEDALDAAAAAGHAIAGASTLDELIAAVRAIPVIRGSWKDWTGAEQADAIAQVRRGMPINAVTRGLGLRAKVGELLKVDYFAVAGA